MHLTLFVPDLFWPDVDNHAAFDVPGTTSLVRFLSLSEMTTTPMAATVSWESYLTELFGFTGVTPGLALLRSRGDGLDEPGIRLCADPVNLDFVQQSLVLSPIPAQSLSAEDMAALITRLNEEFSGEGRFVSSFDPDYYAHGYFIPESNAGVLPDLAACSRLAGRRIDADETRQILGRENLHWLNRIQMCLNEHPVNAAREAVGLPRINSLWPWGAGSLSGIPATTFATANGHSPLLRGLCLSTGTPLQRDAVFPCTPGAHLVAELDCATAVQNDDLDAWRSATTRFDQTWISPALAAFAVRDGKLQTLTLVSPDAHQVRRWTLQRHHLHSRTGWLKRIFGIQPTIPSLGTLVRTW